jgi:hypothetical protein
VGLEFRLLADAAKSAIEEKAPKLSERQKDLLFDDELEEIKKLTSKFIEYGEYITIEIDTETQEAKVVPV